MKVLDSNRTGHVAAAAVFGLGILAAAAIIRSPGLVISAVTIPLWELCCTPDVDINTRSSRKGPWYRRLWVLWWKPYARMVSHRSKWSHSLFWGLPLRFIWGPMFFLWALMLLPGPQATFTAKALITWWPWVLTGCVVADTVHMLKDGYGLVQIMFGK